MYLIFFLKPSLTFFWCRSYEIAIFKKLTFNVLQSQNIRIGTKIHSELSIWPFGISCAFLERVTMGYHGISYALPYILPYVYGNFESFLLANIFKTLPEVLLNGPQYILYIAVNYPTLYHALPEVFSKKY